ncbi:MAG: tRNA threonylcarbamoyladenosine dehydratase [Alphaproteobacteria bacterium]|nr:tRNA threonylcarbamoyladenosine dehydratase [Alphaproteobacteria bacterium]
MINEEQFSRTELLIGKQAVKKLQNARVAVFGLGGVGGGAVEALARSGIGSLDLIDNDVFDLSNLNRQILALYDTIGKYKVDIAAQRIKQINPDCKVKCYKMFYLPEEKFNFDNYDYIVDAIDTVAAKISLIVNAAASGIPIISVMGAGNKMRADLFEIADIYQTSVCPLAHVMRKELKKRGVKNVKVVYSREKALKPLQDIKPDNSRRQTPGSMPFVPAVAGFIAAGEVIKDIIAY